MSKQTYYEDVTTGDEIPPLIKRPTTQQLVRWAGAANDYYAVHYDKDFAQSQGLPGVIVQGQLIGCFLGQLITDWIGEQGVVRKISCTFRGMMFPDEDITCEGKVIQKYIHDECCVECEVWAENAKGERMVLGTAVVILPTRGEGSKASFH